MATTIVLKGLSISSYSLPLLRSWKTRPPAPSHPMTRSLKALFLPYNRIILRGCPSFCVSPNVNAEATAQPERETDNNEPTDNIKYAANLLDIRVGRIIKAWRHEEADSLYVEEVDVGEPQPRIICSGLVNYIPLNLLQDTKVVVLANLKPRNMRGVKSCGMLMAASDASHQNVELLVPPAASVPGDRIWFGNKHDQDNQPDPATPSQVQKKKIWELVQPHLKTDASRNAMIGEHLMQTSAGVVVCKSLKNANIS
ncbi:aminoacyl tRNA synthase complex-interacting multifunctional protein 1 [Durio zibethinus]|uniref:Aminoacyl tRNA synthase complex-interacting multifunctional protein 1 n=1 Tax=Durio zibethinus TaxID=66656 RepID=A0A6P6AHT8_DURZI|nr:aminoacyl tRNA synthase complex-interacting multifunctional protein 1 [Durio zibethinus]XP_022764437.1 aminoacyl tRNA synthase complex-interacting multifunctional protein 1 [Durio zibethinus]XP_022764438.1 aminoacyl tRNA synthase complex-interacting multifunctional protein 1 [Durio zibethinus]